MKLHKLTFAIAAVALLGGCSTFQPGAGATYRAGPNYNATGSVSGVRAYVYGNRTLLQYDSAPLSLWVTDNAGNSVEFEEVGGFYRLARKLDHFTARANLLKATSFDLLPASLKAPANPPEQPPAQAAIEQPSPMVYAAPTAQPPKMLPVALDPRPAVKLASEIAQARANSARQFLVGHGVDPEKIKVSSLAAGDRIAPNSTTEGRDVNRRVEVEIINPRIAGLLRDSGAIADSKQASASQTTLAN